MIIWDADDNAIKFQLQEEGDHPIQPEEWSRKASEGDLAGVVVLMALVDNDRAEYRENTIQVPNTEVALLGEEQAKALHLPPPVSYVLDITHEHTLDQPSFRFHYRWLNQGMPVVMPRRNGVLLCVGQRKYRLREPYYSIVRALDEFNANPPDSLDKRFAKWAEIRRLYLEHEESDTRLDRYLENTRIAAASCFSLKATERNGEFDFEPVLVQAPGGDDESPDQVRELLPPYYQGKFQQRFRQCGAQHRYAVDHGWYVVADKRLKSALAVVRKFQMQEEKQRRAFFRNPVAFIQKEIGEEIGGIEGVFVETEAYSERVLGEGVWQSKVIPWVKKAAEPWLPPERLGVLLGNIRVVIDAKDVPRLIEKVNQAIQEGKPSVRYNSTEIPANDETLKALASLQGIIIPKQQQPNGAQQEEREKKIVLLIEDNLDDVGYKVRSRPHRDPSVGSNTPAILRTALKPHQIEGLRWLQDHWRSGSPGAILADDMGLGKTLQCLAFLAWLQEEMEAGIQQRMPFGHVPSSGV